MRLRYTPRATRDIARIYQHIADNSPRAAQRVENAIRKRAKSLGDNPKIGVPTDLADVRRVPLARYPYTIFYRIVASAETVDILRVVHAAQVRNLDQAPE